MSVWIPGRRYGAGDGAAYQIQRMIGRVALQSQCVTHEACARRHPEGRPIGHDHLAAGEGGGDDEAGRACESKDARSGGAPEWCGRGSGGARP